MKASEPIELLHAAKHALATGTPTTLVSVVATRGSAPRVKGAAMLVSAQSVVATVGGGHLEHTAIALARSGVALPFEKEYPLGASVGQCCGGAMTLRYETLSTEHVARFVAEGAALKSLFLFGAGHVAQSLQPILAALPLKVVWIDSRDAMNAYQTTFPLSLPPQVCALMTDTPEAELELARAGDLALIMTHSHALDEVLVQAALRKPQLAYIGLIGSLTKRRLFEQRLGQRGFQNLDFARVTCPIGIQTHGGPHSKWPAIIAVQIAAQMLAYL